MDDKEECARLKIQSMDDKIFNNILSILMCSVGIYIALDPLVKMIRYGSAISGLDVIGYLVIFSLSSASVIYLVRKSGEVWTKRNEFKKVHGL